MARNAEFIQTWLKLISPWEGVAVEAPRRGGCLFGGTLSRWLGGGGIPMRKPLYMPDFHSMQRYSESSRQLHAILQSEGERCQGGSGGRKR